MIDIGLNKRKSIDSVNKESSINLELSSKTKLLTDTRLIEKFDLYEEYSLERDHCTDYRFIFNIFPYTTNALYNRVTEIVNNEGSDNCSNLLYTSFLPKENNFSNHIIDHSQAMRDTEYSHKDLGNFVYHCGIDIFNNHRLRCKSFKHVEPFSDQNDNRLFFNTLSDFSRDGNGNDIMEDFYFLEGDRMKKVSQKKHLYQYDDIDDMYSAFRKRKMELNGWHGFKNPATIQIGIGKDNVEVNRLLNNNKPFEFIDFYPDRSLFSFMPKRNRFRNRDEYNWEYALMYPYESDYEKFNYINGNTIDALHVVRYERVSSPTGGSCIQFESMLRHNLKKGDRVKIFYRKNSSGPFIEGKLVSEVYDTGDITDSNKDREHFFSIKEESVSYFMIIEAAGELDRKLDIAFKKIVEGTQCEYYFRKYKKMENALCTNGRIAFSQTIFGEGNAQVIFNEKIDMTDIVDNRGRGLTEVYLNIEKRNVGYEKWYSSSRTSGEDIEFSHCFGKVTSGLDLTVSSTDFNVHKLNNIDLDKLEEVSDRENNYYSKTAEYFEGYLSPEPKSKFPEPIEDDIGSETNEFYGDIVEYSPVTDHETVIETVYHRFNTAQRECTDNPAYFNLYMDYIENDDYGFTEDGNGPKDGKSLFRVRTENISFIEREGESGTAFYNVSNLAPEGYYYKPLYKVDIKRKAEAPSGSQGQSINCDFNGVSLENYVKDPETGKFNPVVNDIPLDGYVVKRMIRVVSPKNFGFSIGDKLFLYDRKKKKNFWGKLEAVENNVILYVSFELEKDEEIPELSTGRYNLVLSNGDVPEYASYLNNSNQMFIWREELLLSQVDSKDPLFNIPFSNGSLYFENNISFFLRRQDPFGIYGLRGVNENKRVNILNNFTPNGEEYVSDDIEYISLKDNAICN